MINQFGQYAGNHKPWDHVGNILPNTEYYEGNRPTLAKGRPAEWLPTQFYEKYFENHVVIMPGKVLAVDNNGHFVPAGLKIPAELDGTGDVVTYTLTDVQAGVINVATGSPVTLAELTDPGQTRGYTATEIATVGFLGQGSGVALSISHPIGVAPTAILQWAGGDGSNPVDYRHHNYNMQHQVALVCDYVMEMALVPAVATAEAVTFSSPSANISTGSLAETPVAASTMRTPFAFAGGASASLFVNLKTDVALVKGSGDYHVNLATGLVTVYAAVQPTGITATYSHYAAEPAAVSTFACAVGDLKGGDLVTFDANSNYRIANQANLYLSNAPTGIEVARAMGLVVGQVLESEVINGKAFLDRVKTAYSPALGTNAAGSKPGYLGQLDQMAGSATGGAPSNVHATGAADTVVRINLIRF